jgi:squalene-associated FAD-dependent desaturase
MAGKVHVVGAGVAGLAAAVRVAASGARVVLHEGAGHGGGRCRSFHDDVLDRTIDNGNHLLLSGNTSVAAFLAETGAEAELAGPEDAAFAFADLKTGARWTLRPNAGPIPWWIFSPARRAPGTAPRDYIAGLRLARAGDATVAECLDTTRPSFARFWEPLVLAVLNAAPDEAAARLLWPVMTEIFGKGSAAARPLIAKEGLSQTFVAPALRALEQRGAEIRFNQRLRAVIRQGERATALDFARGRIELRQGDTVILAVPPAGLSELLPEVPSPTSARAIVNAHFRVEAPLPSDLQFLGLVGATAHWLFIRKDVVSVTVSAADALAEVENDEVARRLWADVARALSLPAERMPPWRVIKEKRATFAQVPAELARRAPARTAWRNLFLAGDWTDTGLPCTIEGAIRSGHRAAAMARAP